MPFMSRWNQEKVPSPLIHQDGGKTEGRFSFLRTIFSNRGIFNTEGYAAGSVLAEERDLVDCLHGIDCL